MFVSLKTMINLIVLVATFLMGAFVMNVICRQFVILCVMHVMASASFAGSLPLIPLPGFPQTFEYYAIDSVYFSANVLDASSPDMDVDITFHVTYDFTESVLSPPYEISTEIELYEPPNSLIAYASPLTTTLLTPSTATHVLTTTGFNIRNNQVYEAIHQITTDAYTPVNNLFSRSEHVDEFVIAAPTPIISTPTPSSLIMALTMMSSVGLILGCKRWKARRGS